jgi:hypothetical protein
MRPSSGAAAMFTLKLYSDSGSSVKLIEAESFSVDWDDGKFFATIVAHSKGTPEYTIGQNAEFDFAIIENSNGKTTERLTPTFRPAKYA